MCGNLNRKPIGRCSECGGVVSIPIVFHSVRRPVPSCEKCGATEDEAANLPVIKTIPRSGYRKEREGSDLLCRLDRVSSVRRAF